ncbi:MAG: hypothetical protein U5N86_03875 [Planctomycetota bacterium]|nr:hypothetical protein [Planctomycetota bacterium]
MYGFQRILIPSTVIAFTLWLVATGWFAMRYEHKQSIAQADNPYRFILENVGDSFERDYVIVSHSDEVIGNAKVSVSKTRNGYIIENDLSAHLSLLAISGRYDLNARLYVGEDYQLDSFNIRVSAASAKLVHLKGTVLSSANSSQTVRMSVIMNDQAVRTFDVPVPQQFNLADMLMPVFHAGKPVPGKEWSTQLIDPLTRKISRANFKILDPDDIPGSKGLVSGYPVVAKFGNREFLSFVDEKGDVMWEEVPYGFILIRSDIAPILIEGYKTQEQP